MKLDPKVERILEWRESFSSLPDDYFFDIIHMYLGEIKTPYNKPKLIEELSTILRKKENNNPLPHRMRKGIFAVWTKKQTSVKIGGIRVPGGRGSHLLILLEGIGVVAICLRRCTCDALEQAAEIVDIRNAAFQGDRFDGHFRADKQLLSV